MHKTLFGTLGVSAGAVALALFAYTAQAQAPKKDAPKKPPACSTLKDESACKARDDCTWSETKDKKGKAKGACKAKPKAPAKKAEPKKK